MIADDQGLHIWFMTDILETCTAGVGLSLGAISIRPEADFRPKFWPKWNNFLTIWIEFVRDYKSVSFNGTWNITRKNFFIFYLIFIKIFAVCCFIWQRNFQITCYATFLSAGEAARFRGKNFEFSASKQKQISSVK